LILAVASNQVLALEPPVETSVPDFEFRHFDEFQYHAAAGASAERGAEETMLFEEQTSGLSAEDDDLDLALLFARMDDEDSGVAHQAAQDFWFRELQERETRAEVSGLCR
jgi:hypothetical protein